MCMCKNMHSLSVFFAKRCVNSFFCELPLLTFHLVSSTWPWMAAGSVLNQLSTQIRHWLLSPFHTWMQTVLRHGCTHLRAWTQHAHILKLSEGLGLICTLTCTNLCHTLDQKQTVRWSARTYMPTHAHTQTQTSNWSALKCTSLANTFFFCFTHRFSLNALISQNRCRSLPVDVKFCSCKY